MNVHMPIGVFDSGLGGLSVVREIRRRLPNEAILYAADSRFCPYGVRSEAEIRERSLLVAAALVAAGAKLLVIACNTATAVALEALRATFPLPIVGLEPAVKPAVARSRAGVVGVLATPRTAGSDRLRGLIERYAGESTTVLVMPAPGLVELVESGATDGSPVRDTVRGFLDPLLEAGADTIVLGCTHYPFLRDTIQAVAGPAVDVIDSGEAIARRTYDLLTVHGLHAASGTGSLELLTTGEPIAVEAAARRLLWEPARVRNLASAYEGGAPLNCSAAWASSSSGLA